MNIAFFDRPYVVGPLKAEMEIIKGLALSQMQLSRTITPHGFVFTDDTLYVFNLKQFDTQRNAQKVLNDFSKDKGAKFFIVAGLTSAPNKLASQYTDYFLNIVAHVDSKVVWQIHTMMLSADVFTIIESTENMSALGSKEGEEGVKQIIDAENDDNAFDVEGIELEQNPFA
jgi:hypothetical protein